MKINEIITELFDIETSYPLEWEFREYPSITTASATDSNRNSIEIDFDSLSSDGDDVVISFSRNNSYGITNKRDANRVFATVIKAIDIYIKKYNPAYIAFSAEEASRAKLYQAMIQRIAKGYTLLTQDQYPPSMIAFMRNIGSLATFVLKRN